MLSETNRRNKENIIKYDTSTKESGTLVHSTIANLREEITALQQEKCMIERQWIAQVDLLTLELGEYKKKLSSLTDKYLIETITKERSNSKEPVADHERIIREKQIQLQQEQESKRRVQQQLKKFIDQNTRLKKQVTILRYEKQKNMEISLIEKIQFEERNKLLEEEVKSKKQIISNLKKQLQRSYSDREEIGKRQRAIEQKSKELDCFSKEVNEYNRLSEAKLNQKLQRLQKQNEFLKNYVKKLQKIAKKECQCEQKDQKVKQNLFQIKRELALAKVRLGQSYLKRKQTSKRRCDTASSSEQSTDKKPR